MLTCSALEGSGIAELWQAVGRHRRALEAGDELAAKRARQSRSWLWAEVQAGLLEALRADPGDRRARSPSSSRRSPPAACCPPQAARALVARFRAGEPA